MRDSTGYRLLIPRAFEVTPLLPHAYIVKDKIYDIYTIERNYNKYFSPSKDRLKEVRQLSGRSITSIRKRKTA